MSIQSISPAMGKEEYARTVVLEMGKPIVQGEAEVEKCAEERYWVE